jgi:hypothetical protein
MYENIKHITKQTKQNIMSKVKVEYHTPIINWCDYQWRIWKNKPEIKWKNKVHEVLEGYKIMSSLPSEEEYCLHHPKTIDRQEKQNSYYDTL